jgi:ABC-2 type transport system ATP-binding protein
MISIENLTFQYQKQHKLFDKLNLELKTGNIYGLLGKNGAGKTTLLKIISGLLYAQSGECILNGTSTKNRNPSALQDVFFIPEEFELPVLSIESFQKIHAPFYPKFNNEEFHSYLNQFGIHSGLKIKNLSFGQVKMVIISFGLAAHTKYLILDEPSNALDIPSKSLLRKFLAGAIDETRSFIISTHQVRDLESLIDPIIILDAGKVIMHNACDEIVEKLCFKTVRDLSDEDVLYSEEKLGKFEAVCLNTKKEESRLNLELLFNGVTQNYSAFEKILTQ